MKKQKEHSRLLTELAKKIKSRRCEIGITQKELAERANFHSNYIGGIERGERNLSIGCLANLAKALEISPKELIPENTF